MGLSGRKVKQRIGNDPRNLSWADDAGRFGQAYLEKFGWDSSKGLGMSGEGRTSALKATQKLDMLGIGMQHQKDPNGIAWRQNRDFENLLRRLNDEVATETSGPFHKAREEGGEKEAAVVAVDDEGATKKKKKGKGKKRKALEEKEGTLEPEGPDDKRQRKKRRRKLRDGDDDDAADAVQHVAPAPDETDASESRSARVAAAATPMAASAPVLRAPPRTHRARIIAAKRMAASNSTALAEILGIPSSSSSSSTPSAFATTSSSPFSTTPTPATTTEDAQDPLQKLTTATQSVGDYFKAKLGAKAAQPPRSNLAPSDAVAAAAALDDDDRPLRVGLGASRPVPIEAPSDERKRGEIGASSKFAAMFALGRQATPDTGEGNVASVDVDVTRDADGDEDDRGKSEKKRAKEERRKAKEERRRKRAEARSGTATGSLDGGAVDVPVGETLGGDAKRKKHRELGAPESHIEGAPSGSGMEGIPTKKRKKRDKDRKKSRKDHDPEE
ncbi:hypothetical protein BJV78DRAFT_714270 [Lactifluus subvellereus]|nr:hypothetical protein BJV78DRAFT_714270 [Lactifluus subvellereus]